MSGEVLRCPLRSESNLSNKEAPLDSPSSSVPCSPSPAFNGSSSDAGDGADSSGGSGGSSGAGSNSSDNGGNRLGAHLTGSGSDGNSTTNLASSVSNTMNRTNSTDLNGGRRPSFGLNFLSSFTSSMRLHSQSQGQSQSQTQSQTQSQNHPQVRVQTGQGTLSTFQPNTSSNSIPNSNHSSTNSPNSSSVGPLQTSPSRNFMSNSPTIANFGSYNLNSEPLQSNQPVIPETNDEHTSNDHSNEDFSSRRPTTVNVNENEDTDLPSSPTEHENRENQEHLEDTTNDMDTTVVPNAPQTFNVTNLNVDAIEEEEPSGISANANANAFAGTSAYSRSYINDVGSNINTNVNRTHPSKSKSKTPPGPSAPTDTDKDEKTSNNTNDSTNGKDKDGYFSVRLTPLIDHSSSNSGLYFAPVIRKAKCNKAISIGRYTEKNKASACAPQGSDAPIVFKSKVVSRTHALFQCNEDGQWFVKDCKSSSGTFLNHIRLSPASQESSLMPLIDGDIIQLGMDYRGGTEEVYRSVKMRCEFNKSWQRKVNQFNLQMHQKLKNLSVQNHSPDISDNNQFGLNGQLDNNPINDALQKDGLSECAICLLKLEPCQALFISPCSHSWHYKCIRPIIIKSYPQFYCPNCRSMCDLETDIEDED